MTKEFTMPSAPKWYRKQGLSHCGLYSIEAILSASGLNNQNNKPNSFSQTLFQRILGITSISALEEILRVHGFETSSGTAINLSDQEKLVFLKKKLFEGKTIIICIGNGYMNARSSYCSLKACVASHWITLWGYNETRRVFYIYDSKMPRNINSNLPIGNTEVSYDDLLRDWAKRGIRMRPRRNLYILAKIKLS